MCGKYACHVSSLPWQGNSPPGRMHHFIKPWSAPVASSNTLTDMHALLQLGVHSNYVDKLHFTGAADRVSKLLTLAVGCVKEELALTCRAL
jgi:hypothetical protein